MPFVGAGLGHCVDVTGRELAVEHIERRQFHGYLLNGVIGERLAFGRIAIAVQAEQVIHPHAVNGQAVETRVGASALHRTTGVSGVNIDPWVVIDYVAQIAVDVWHFLQVCQAENR